MVQKSITIDLWQKYSLPIDFNQHEAKGRTLNITLTSGGQPVDLTACAVTFNMTKSSNVIYNACTITDATLGKISLLIEGAICDTAGTFDAFIEIIDTVDTDNVLRTQTFDVTVNASDDNSEAVEGSSDFTALTEALAQTTGLDSRITQNEMDIATNETDIQTNVDDIDALELMAVNENLIFNGNFDICQRGTSQTSSGYGSDDRWKNENTGSTKTHSRQSFTIGQTDVPNNPKYFSRTVVTSVAGSGNNCWKRQPIENVLQFSGKNVILSFWAKADATKNMAIEFIELFGSGGTTPVIGVGVNKIELSTSWQKFVITETMPSMSGVTIGDGSALDVRFWFDAGSNFDSRTASLGNQSGTFDIAQVKLEKGSVATPFVPKTFAEELRDCQRYYCKTYNYDDVAGAATSDGAIIEWATRNSAAATNGIRFPVEMRDVPTVTPYSTAGAAGKIANGGDKAAAAMGVGTSGVRYFTISGGTAASNADFHCVADAEL